MSAELPNGWRVRPIKDVADVISGATPSRDQPHYWGGNVPWITPKELGGIKTPIVSSTVECITEDGFRSSSCQMLPVGAVLLSSRAPIGHLGIAGIPMCSNQGLKSLVPYKGISSGYLYHVIRANIGGLIALGRGATFKEVSKTIVEEFRLPFPDSETEQERIAGILDKADGVRRKRKEALRLTDELLRSVFLEMFGDPVTNPKGWPSIKAGDLFADKPRLGTTRPATGRGYLVVRVGEIGSESVKFTQCGRVEQTEDELKRFRLSSGDILIARAIGSREQLGKCSFFDGHEETVVGDSHVMRLRPDSAKCEPYWLYFLLASPPGRRLLQSKGGATAVQFNINGAQACDVDIPLPPMDLQRKFVKIANSSRQGRMGQTEAQIQADTFFDALQQRAFNGDL